MDYYIWLGAGGQVEMSSRSHIDKKQRQIPWGENLIRLGNYVRAFFGLGAAEH